MPRTITGQNAFVTSLPVPRDGEAIDAADVAAPIGDLLNNDQALYGLISSLKEEVRLLKQRTGGFTLATPAVVNVEPGQTYALANFVSIGRIDGYAGTVDLSALALPAGVSAAFSPDPASGPVSNLTLTVAPEAVAGPFDAVVRGVGSVGGFVAESPLRINVAAQTAPPGFTISAPDNATLSQGGGTTTATLSIDVQRQGQYADPITLSVQGLPAGVTGTFSATPVTGSAPVQNAASVLTLTATGVNTPSGDYSVTIRATGGNVVRTEAVLLRVAAPVQAADFQLTVTYDAGNRELINGATIGIQRQGGFTGPVAFTVMPALNATEPQPTFILNGQAGSTTATGTSVRITADGSLIGRDVGVAPVDILTPWSNRQVSVLATANIDGRPVVKGVTVTYRQGRVTTGSTA